MTGGPGRSSTPAQGNRAGSTSPWGAGFRVALAFLIFGILWITLSDHALTLITTDSEALTRLQTYKGWAFVVGTAFLILFMVRREVRARTEQEERFRRLAENAPDLIYRFRLEPSPAFEYVSPVSEALTGYPPEAFYKDPELGQRLVPPEGGAGLPLNQRATPDSASPRVGQWVRQDGGRIWIEQREVPVLDGSGKVIAIEGIARDISERKEAEAQLLERAEYERSLLTSSPVAILAMDLDGKLLTWNPAAERIFGWTTDEVMGRPVPTVPRQEVGAFQNLLEKVREGETLRQMELSQLRKDGSPVLVSVSASPIRTEDGRVVGIMSAMADITEQRRAERVLAEERALHFKIMETSPVGITVLDPNGSIVFANPFAEELLGLTLDEITQRSYNAPDWTITDLAGGPFPDDELPFRRVMDTGRPVFDVRHGIGKQGQRRTLLSVNAAPLKGEAGEITGVVAVIEDITEQIAHQEEREQMEVQLRQAQRMEAVGRLAGGVAHDFNNMLAVILGSAEMALATITPEDPLFQDLTNIHSSAARSAELTRQLLAFSRKQVIRPRATNLNRLLRDQEKILQRLMGEEIHLRLELARDLWPTYIDVSQVDQILTNLLVNSRDAIRGTGTITIATGNVHVEAGRRRDDFPIEEGPYVLLSVQDTGEGIDEATLEHIFEPFFTTKGQGEGTGLGLATVYGIVKQNGGFIDVASHLKKGTTFSIYLPRHDRDPEEEAQVAGAAPEPGSETILVVEDEEMVGALAHRFLESQGYRVFLDLTPGEALARVRSMDEPIHLLVTDVVLPEMSGKELQAAIRALRPDIKVLYMSGYSSDIIAERGILDTGVNFIEKPFSTGALGRQVREILDG